ncbi:uncharacterized protein CLUP02_04682 [Colletotrichum lupini]|uniref:Uncharacterized protein n=1 Tax=Colletotrichum lupini TaxID=145971 RepID=A0A9Q8SLA3_9PEZI|nr:uncharacterized protein CLUP02_04682 [Colletotrichum lupini]UQC79203.1 hypothetical protein CLUP02_04682 [Colletotrichum lupini]
MMHRWFSYFAAYLGYCRIVSACVGRYANLYLPSLSDIPHLLLEFSRGKELAGKQTFNGSGSCGWAATSFQLRPSMGDLHHHSHSRRRRHCVSAIQRLLTIQIICQRVVGYSEVATTTAPVFKQYNQLADTYFPSAHLSTDQQIFLQLSHSVTVIGITVVYLQFNHFINFGSRRINLSKEQHVYAINS